MSFDAPTIKGEKTELKNGLFSINCECEDPGEKMMAFWNSNKELQFNVTYEFQAPEITALSDTINEGAKYAITVYPGETKEFVRGKWKASRRTLSFGAPDKEWLEKQSAQVNEGVDLEVKAVKMALKKNPKADGKYTSEYIADVCLKESTAFVDLSFPPKPTSVAREFEGKAEAVPWMRPATYCPEGKSPCLYSGEIEPNDIDQGALGNCYFLCALACVSEFPNLVKDVFSDPPNSAFGIYRVRICKNGWWQVCVIDDLLPINPKTNLPLYAKNREEPEELWVSLIEKAYAKLHGSYAAIKTGDPAMAMADLVGGPYERFNNRPEWEDKEKFFEYLKECDDLDHLMALGTPGCDTTDYSKGGGAGTTNEIAEKYKKVGLVSGHAFSLIRVKESHGHKLCMIRNPWGNETEWNGDWSDDSKCWTPEIKKDVGFYAGDDGTFWMCWKDVIEWFEFGSVTYVLPTYSQMRVCGNFEKGFPDLVVQVYVTKSVKCWFGGHQRDNRGLPTGDKDSKYLGLLLAVLQEQENGKVKKIEASGKGQFLMARDVFAQCTLEPQEKPYYILLQSYQDQDKSFVLSAFFDDHASVKVHFVTAKSAEGKVKCNPPTKFVPANSNQKAAANFQLITPAGGCVPFDGTGDGVNWSAVSKAPKKERITTGAPKRIDPTAQPPQKLKLSITIVSGHGLVAKDSNGFSDPFVTVIKLDSQGNKYKKEKDTEKSTKYINKTLDPVWGETFTFSCFDNDIFLFECWDKDVFGKDAMGEVKVNVKSLGVTPGGAGKMGQYNLTGGDATGHIQLLFTALN